VAPGALIRFSAADTRGLVMHVPARADTAEPAEPCVLVPGHKFTERGPLQMVADTQAVQPSSGQPIVGPTQVTVGQTQRVPPLPMFTLTRKA
jgi:hypothetical protein